MRGTNHMEDQRELTPDEVLTGKRKEDKSIEDILFSPLPDDYFKNNDCLQFDNRNPIEKAIDAYNNAPIKPYIRRTQLGGDGDPFNDDDEARKTGWEIGLEFKF